MAKKIVMKNPDGTVECVRYVCKKGVNLQPFKKLYQEIKNVCKMKVVESEHKTCIWFTFTAPVIWE